MGEESLHGSVAVGDEPPHFVLGIPFGDVGNVYAACGVLCPLQCQIWRNVPFAYVPDENVRWSHRVRQRCHCLPPVVPQVDRYVNGVLWEWHEEDVLEGFGLCLCLGVGEPFLEERGEGVAVDDLPGLMVSHGNLSVALQGQFRQPLSLAVPSRDALQLVDGDVLFPAVPGEDIVYPQGGVGEVFVEVLRPCREAGEHDGE